MIKSPLPTSQRSGAWANTNDWETGTNKNGSKTVAHSPQKLQKLTKTYKNPQTVTKTPYQSEPDP